MSIFGDIGKLAKKGIKKLKKVGGEIVKATRPVRGAIGAIPVVGGAVRTGLDVADPLLTERERKKKGRPPTPLFTPRLQQQQRRFLQRTLGAGLRLAGAPATAPTVPAVRVSPARARPVPSPVTRIDPLTRRPIPMARLVPARGPIQAQPALRFQVPRQFKDPLGVLREQIPFKFGEQPGDVPITPLTDSVDKLGRPLVVAPAAETRVRCPPGYLAITMPDGSRACALAGVAIAAGLAKRRKKPIISIRDSNAIRRAERARGRLKRVTENAGFVVRMKGSVRRRARKT